MPTFDYVTGVAFSFSFFFFIRSRLSLPHTILDKFEIWPDRTRVQKKHCPSHVLLSFDKIFMKLTDNQDTGTGTNLAGV